MGRKKRSRVKRAESRSKRAYRDVVVSAIDIHALAVTGLQDIPVPIRAGVETPDETALDRLLCILERDFDTLVARMDDKRNAAWEIAMLDVLTGGLLELAGRLPKDIERPTAFLPGEPGVDMVIYSRLPPALIPVAGFGAVPTSEVLILLKALLAELEAILAAEGAVLTVEEAAILRTVIDMLRDAIAKIAAHGKRIPLARVEAIIDQLFRRLWQLGERLALYMPRILGRLRLLTTDLSSSRLWLRHILRVVARYIPHLAALLIGMLIGYQLRKTKVSGVTLGSALDDNVYDLLFAPAGNCVSRYRQFTYARSQKLKARATGQKRLERVFARQEIRAIARYLNSGCPDKSQEKQLRRLFLQLSAIYRKTWGKR